MQNEWSPHSVIQDLGVLVTAVSGILAMWRSISGKKERTSSQSEEGPIKPIESRPVGRRLHIQFSWAWFLAGAVFFTLLAVFKISDLYSEKPVVVMVGSGNVESFLTEKVPDLRRLHPVMIDLGSGEGMKVVFQEAEWGAKSLHRRNNEAIVALSSAGDQGFKDAMMAAPPGDRKGHNWLSIEVATPPLGVLYTKPSDRNQAKLLPLIEMFPGHENYRYIRCSTLTNYYSQVPNSGVVLPSNVQSTGTRNNIEAACGPIKLRNDSQSKDVLDRGEPLHFVEDYLLGSVYVDLKSWAPESAKSGRSASCEDLSSRNLQASVICTKCDSISDIDRARFVVFFSLKYDSKTSQHSIASDSACMVARAIAPNLKSCEIGTNATWEDVNGYELATIKVPQLNTQEIPDYLKCP
jgi:hypothetical protein